MNNSKREFDGQLGLYDKSLDEGYIKARGKEPRREIYELGLGDVPMSELIQTRRKLYGVIEESEQRMQETCGVSDKKSIRYRRDMAKLITTYGVVDLWVLSGIYMEKEGGIESESFYDAWFRVLGVVARLY